MKSTIYLRPLTFKDAETSYKWRNNPKIWRHSKFQPSNPITLEIEQNWILKCLSSENECRRAICLTENDEYIGNVQVIDIENERGVFHLFIGEEAYWGKGIGAEASRQLLKYVFTESNIEEVMLEVHTENLAARSIYQKLGFYESGREGDYIVMLLTRYTYLSVNSPSEGVLVNP